MSLQAVEARSDQEFKASVLGAYERGERAISVPRLQRLAALYEVSVDRLLPAMAPAAAPDPARAPEPELIDLRSPRDHRLAIDLRRLAGWTAPERELLGRYVATIQARRREPAGSTIAIRADDFRTLAMLLDVPVDTLRERLDRELAAPQPV